MNTKQLLVAFAVIAAGVHSHGEEGVVRSYWVEAEGYSLGADLALESYKPGSRVGGMVGSGLGIGTLGEDEPVSVSLRPLLKSGRLLVELTREPKSDGNESTEQHDLTNLQPKTLEVTKDKDGRTYRLTLRPSISVRDLRPKPFAEATERLYNLHFSGSRVVLNDKDYIGRMAASSADFFSIDISGFALVEFSLRRLKDAKPWGTLNGGVLTISNPDENVFFEIGNVTNGDHEQALDGGPYQVWVRWKPPTTTIEQMRSELESLRQRVEAGEFSGQPGMAARLDTELSREPGPWVVGSSARKASAKDLADPSGR